MSAQDYTTYISGVSQGATITGDAIPMRGFSRVFVTSQWTDGDSAAVHTQSVQGSNDGTNWAAFVNDSGTALAFTADPAGAGAGSSSISVSDIASRYIRIVSTAGTPGTGLYSAQVWIS